MSLIGTPFNPSGERLPEAFDGCMCDCHRMAGVSHVIACCGTGRTPLFKILTSPETTDQDLKDLEDLVGKVQRGEVSAQSPFEGMDRPWTEQEKTNLKTALGEIFGWPKNTE